MTYEKFCTKVLEVSKEDEAITRKTVRNTAIKLLIIYGEIAIALGYLVGCVISSISAIVGIVTFIALAFSTFDYISETKETYVKWAKVAKFWWVGLILMIAAVLAMKIFFR